MSIVNFLKQTFLQPQTAETPDLVPEAVLNINFKILVVEFADNVESNCGETLAQVFTDVRYTKKDNEAMSAGLLQALKQQGFLD